VRWLLRAQWYAAELLQTFEEEVGEVALRPAVKDVESGVFRVQVESGDGRSVSVWNRKRDGFPEIAELKRRLRDQVAPKWCSGTPIAEPRTPARAAGRLTPENRAGAPRQHQPGPQRRMRCVIVGR
jgi:selenoprotein W-related protein